MSIEDFVSKMNVVLPPAIKINQASKIEQSTPALMKLSMLPPMYLLSIVIILMYQPGGTWS